MSFSLFEIGNQSGRPVFLYEFTWGTTIWRYTSADRDIEWPVGLVPARMWTAVAISDEGVIQGSSPSEFTVSCPASLPLVQLFRTTPPALPIWLRVRRFHRDDPAKEGTVYWVGTVGNVKRVGRAQAKIMGLPISGTFRRSGLRLCWERNCPHMLYDHDCKADKNLFRSITSITGLTGATITVDSLGAWAGPQFNGGFFEWEPAEAAAGTVERRGIAGHTGGTTFSVFGQTDRLEIGQAVTLYLGCDLTAETCDGTFDNIDNHGGFKFMPGESPFDGKAVF